MPKSTRIPSPCIGVCQVKNQSCIGCGRTLDQIGRWSSMASGERDGLMCALGNHCPGCHRILPLTDGKEPASCPECGQY